MDKENKFDPKSLSKPIGAVEDEPSWLESLLSPKKQIRFEKEKEAPVTEPDTAKQTAEQDKKKEDKSFFRADKGSWPLEPGDRQETDNRTSIRWIIAGSLTVVVLVVVILASFGLVNMIRDGVEEQSLTSIEQRVKQASELIEQGELTSAKQTVEEILSSDDTNQKASELLKEINRQIGSNMITELLAVNETDLTMSEEEKVYIGDNQHFSVNYVPNWEQLETDYDIKFDAGDSTLAVRSMPAMTSLAEAELTYRKNITQDNYVSINQREDVQINNLPAKIFVAENDLNYLVSVIVHKYYFAYEISGIFNKSNYSADDMNSLKHFLDSFTLLSEFDLATYDNLAVFNDTNFVFRTWPQTLTEEEKEYIIAQFTDDYQNITNVISMSIDDNINVYLYPDWKTLHDYTLADNSFSKLTNNEVHIVFISPQEHQSFGYETTKLIILNQIDHQVEPLVLEGLATYLDQTNRDYRELVRENQYIPLEELLGVNWKLNQSGDVKYFIAGTFTEYLIDRYGIDAYINLLQSEQFPIAYENNYSLTLSELESNYLVDLGI